MISEQVISKTTRLFKLVITQNVLEKPHLLELKHSLSVHYNINVASSTSTAAKVIKNVRYDWDEQ